MATLGFTAADFRTCLEMVPTGAVAVSGSGRGRGGDGPGRVSCRGGIARKPPLPMTVTAATNHDLPIGAGSVN